MTIILDRNNPPKAKYVRKPKPLNMTQSEKAYYYQSESEKWIYGTNDLTGFQYFFLQEWNIFDSKLSKMSIPIWRESDDEVFRKMQEAEQNFKNFLLVLNLRNLVVMLLGTCGVPLRMLFVKD